MYSFATQPDITFFFQVPPEVAVNRILDGRPTLKYHEAGMDLGLAADPYESFRIFQGRINDAYISMVPEYGFTVIDATQPIDVQQQLVRRIVSERIDLPDFKWKVRSRV
ncbi:MAG: Thymidylate kinase [bacterium ADurb.Bin431]|nr:MAG: Thymidylate kinase [bacterium ADurb.Bin431]